MIYILVGIIILQFAYSVYKDESFKRERERLQLKLMSRDITEYKEAVEEEPKQEENKQEDRYEPLDQVPVETLMGAKDAL